MAQVDKWATDAEGVEIPGIGSLAKLVDDRIGQTPTVVIT